VWSAGSVFVCALALLGRSEQSLPPVQLVERAPPEISRSAEGYALYSDRRIVLITSTAAFRRARRAASRCGDVEAIRKIASVLAHEEWHLLHGPDEQGAYHAQLTTLASLGADSNSLLYQEVVRSMLAVRDGARRAAKRHLVARDAGPPDGPE